MTITNCHDKQQGRSPRLVWALSIIQNVVDGLGTDSGGRTATPCESADCEMSLKISSPHKRDVNAICKDMTGQKREDGIALLNSREMPTFRYRLEGITPTEIEAINAIEGKNACFDRVHEIQRRARRIVFNKIVDPMFGRNLLLLDDAMPEIVATLLQSAWFEDKRLLKDACAWTAMQNPRAYGDISAYEVKIRRFLRAMALGMIPSMPWDGKDIVIESLKTVKESHTLIASYVYHRALFDDCLFHSAYFHGPVQNPMNALKPFNGEDGDAYIDLCLDIRLANKTK